MGEIAEMMLDGTLCQQCGEYIGSDNGFPTYCARCKRDIRDEPSGQPTKVQCPICKRRVKAAGLDDHTRVVHPRAERFENGGE